MTQLKAKGRRALRRHRRRHEFADPSRAVRRVARNREPLAHRRRGERTRADRRPDLRIRRRARQRTAACRRRRKATWCSSRRPARTARRWPRTTICASRRGRSCCHDARRSAQGDNASASCAANTTTASRRWSMRSTTARSWSSASRFPMRRRSPTSADAAFDAALRLLHLIAGVSYYKAGVPARDRDRGRRASMRRRPRSSMSCICTARPSSRITTSWICADRIRVSRRRRRRRVSADDERMRRAIGLPRRTLVPIGGGKDSLVTVEALKRVGEPATAVWIGDSPLIAACAQRTGLADCSTSAASSRRNCSSTTSSARTTAISRSPRSIRRSSSVAAVLYGFDAIAFSNERSASSATLEYDGQPVNHQWSKGIDFERGCARTCATHVAADLDYFSLLRPLSELAVDARLRARRRSTTTCSRAATATSASAANARRIAGADNVRNAISCSSRWRRSWPSRACSASSAATCSTIAALAPAFDALLEYRDHKPFECVGEGRRIARGDGSARASAPEWREDALVARFADEILPQLDARRTRARRRCSRRAASISFRSASRR